MNLKWATNKLLVFSVYRNVDGEWARWLQEVTLFDTPAKATGTFVEDTTIVLHRGIVYSATLLTSTERYGKGKLVVEKMMKNWRPSPGE